MYKPLWWHARKHVARKSQYMFPITSINVLLSNIDSDFRGQERLGEDLGGASSLHHAPSSTVAAITFASALSMALALAVHRGAQPGQPLEVRYALSGDVRCTVSGTRGALNQASPSRSQTHPNAAWAWRGSVADCKAGISHCRCFHLGHPIPTEAIQQPSWPNGVDACCWLRTRWSCAWARRKAVKTLSS